MLLNNVYIEKRNDSEESLSLDGTKSLNNNETPKNK